MLNENLQDVLVDQVWIDWKKRGFPKYPTDQKWRNLAYQQFSKAELFNGTAWSLLQDWYGPVGDMSK